MGDERDQIKRETCTNLGFIHGLCRQLAIQSERLLLVRSELGNVDLVPDETPRQTGEGYLRGMTAPLRWKHS